MGKGCTGHPGNHHSSIELHLIPLPVSIPIREYNHLLTLRAQVRNAPPYVKAEKAEQICMIVPCIAARVSVYGALPETQANPDGQ